MTSLYLYYGVFTNGMNKYDQKQDRDRYVSSMQGLTLTITFGVFLIFLVTHSVWSDFLGLSPHLIFNVHRNGIYTCIKFLVRKTAI